MQAEERLIIIGGGPSGLSAAIAAAETHPDLSITLLERKGRVGNKLLISGSGQCNVTNTGGFPIEKLPGPSDQEAVGQFLSHYGTAAQRRFLRYAYSGFSVRDLLLFLKRIGVETFSRSDGKVFPKSLNAEEVSKALELRCRDLGIQIKTDTRAVFVKYLVPGFQVETERRETLESEFLLISAGGSSYPATGSDGSGVRFAKALGHHISELSPALSGITLKVSTLGVLSGITLKNTSVTCRRGGKQYLSAAGDLLFTHTGLSGPVIVNNSRLMRRNDTIAIALLPQYLEERESFSRTLNQNGKKQLSRVLSSATLLPSRVVELLLSTLSIRKNQRCCDLKREDILKMHRLLLSWEHTIAAAGRFETAMATSGGVELKEVNPKTMESRILPGLFFAGEVLDIDGETGGYNLQAAFSTGVAAGRSCALKN